MRRLAVLLLLALAAFAAEAADRPKLVLQITVDQLRGDLPLRYESQFGDGGFRYLLRHGTWYADAHHPHAHTETIVGHTTLATGTYPSRHGMIANSWYDRQTNTRVNNFEDARYPVLPINGETQKGSAAPGAILTTTFSDELTITTAGRSKVFAVSMKDRAAIPLAGHTGKAFWFSDANRCFISSTFYYDAYPAWVKDWCTGDPSGRYKDATWNLMHDRSTYLFRDETNIYPAGTPPETNMQMLQGMGFGRTFPHKVVAGNMFSALLTISPFGDELTANFAKELIEHEQLGRHDVTDYLAISFSVTDYIGHWFSPSSLESEDNLLRLDRTLADLFAFVDKQVGLQNTIIVLSGDHGGPEFPEYLQRLGIDSGRTAESAVRAAAEQALTARYPDAPGLISSYSQPYFYLDHAVMQQKHLDPIEVERTVATAVMKLQGVHIAVPTTELERGGEETDTQLIAQIRRNDNNVRSGDVYVVPSPQWQIVDTSERVQLLLHNSGWSYDTFVPIAFAGGDVPASMIWRAVSTTDVAATLAAYLRTKYPSGNVGQPLPEILGAGRKP